LERFLSFIVEILLMDIEKEVVEEEKPKRFRKYFVLILGVILILLIVSYYSVSYGVSYILEGLIQSPSLDEDYGVEFKDFNIIFEKKAYGNLIKIYDENLELEFKACLKGLFVNNEYTINEIVIPKTYSQKYNQVIADPCDSNTLISLHSHPFRRCLPSQQDIKNFKLLKKENDNVLLGIMCEKDRFNFYD
tara:strand:- start:14893 stop:15465 length:573 start_codon:yes stop_codon:yes gene_type:complete